MRANWALAGVLLGCLVAEAGAAVPPASSDARLADAVQSVTAGEPAKAIAALEDLEASSLPSTVRRQTDFLLGILLVRQGQYLEAIPRLERAVRTFPLLADYALWHVAAAYRQQGQRAAAAGALRRLVEGHPDSLFAERASRDLPRDWLEAGDLSQAEEAAGKYLAAFPQGTGRAEVWETLGEALLRSGRLERAEEVLRRVWVELPGSPESQRAKDLLATIPGARPFTPDEQFQRALTLYQAGRNVQAISELAPFASPGDPREGQARLHLGIASFRLRQYGRAIQWLEPLRDGTGSEQSEALYWLARGYGRSGDMTRFTGYLTLLADSAPRTRRAEEGLYLVAQAAADNGDAATARAYLDRLLKGYPKGGWTDAGLWLQGWLAYKGRDAEAALQAWGRLLAEEPGSRFRVPALYWRGRALELAKKPQQAVGAYETILRTSPDQNYYWFHARERLGRLGQRPPSTGAERGAANRPAASDALHIEKARALRSLALVDEAVDEYSQQVKSRPDNRGGLAEACRAYLDLQRYDKAVWLAGGILRPLFVQANGQPPIREFWQCLYPLGHWPIVREQAMRLGLDPLLVTALIREESAFAPRAVSWAGARGLMQLMPQTAEQVTREHNMRPGAAALLETPEVNVELGTLHLTDLIRNYGGNLTLAVAAYNAGRQQVQRWQERFGLADEEEFIEDIPYTETRSYVKRVLGSYQRYGTLYGMGRVESRESRAENEPSAAKEPGKESREPRAERREGLQGGEPRSGMVGDKESREP